MSKTLDQRLEASETLLARVDTALNRHPGRLPREVESTFRALIDYRTEIASWRELVEVRAVTAGMLTDLERTADATDSVPLGTKRVKFAHARFVSVVSHLASTWALADRVSGFVGRMLCTPQAGLNAASSPQLVPWIRDF